MDGTTLDDFIVDAKAFLATAAPDFEIPRSTGDGRVALFPDLKPDEEAEELRLARAWRGHRFDAGFGWLSGPVELGGRGLPVSFERAYVRLEREYRLPPQRMFDIGLGMVAPMVLALGSGEAKHRYLRALHRGDVVGCQLFSEPGAGSDLAGVSTRAEPHRDGWRVTGQKIWSSGAHLSDVGILVCRTGDPAARHRNLTAFLVPMASPGVTVRPIRQMTGGASFNEVFFDDAFVADSMRLGDVDAGWKVVVATLANERAAVGGPTAGGGSGILSTDRLARLLGRSGRLDDPTVRDQLMRLHCATTAARLTRQRSDARARANQPPGPELSIGKLSLTNNLALVTKLVDLALGPRLLADSGEPDSFGWTELLLGLPGLRLGGGSDEIQRNILAERVLGLPR